MGTPVVIEGQRVSKVEGQRCHRRSATIDQDMRRRTRIINVTWLFEPPHPAWPHGQPGPASTGLASTYCTVVLSFDWFTERHTPSELSEYLTHFLINPRNSCSTTPGGPC